MYPTLQQVESADHTQICKWYRFLPLASTPEEVDIMKAIVGRYKANGGMTVEISKRIGH